MPILCLQPTRTAHADINLAQCIRKIILLKLDQLDHAGAGIADQDPITLTNLVSRALNLDCSQLSRVLENRNDDLDPFLNTSCYYCGSFILMQASKWPKNHILYLSYRCMTKFMPCPLRYIFKFENQSRDTCDVSTQNYLVLYLYHRTELIMDGNRYMLHFHYWRKWTWMHWVGLCLNSHSIFDGNHYGHGTGRMESLLYCEIL